MDSNLASATQPKTCFSVGVNAPLEGPLHYCGDLGLEAGTSVRVPLGRRVVDGVVLGVSDLKESTYALKNIKQLNPHRPQLPLKHLEWLRWMSRYYMHPLGKVLSMAFSPLKRRPKFLSSKDAGGVLSELNAAQAKCVSSIEFKAFSRHLLYGVTGSGKTRVYLHLFKKMLSLDPGARGLMLVPEIALTPQLLARFEASFPGQVGVLHSQLKDRERSLAWWGFFEGRYNILLGARSALFCPAPRLGLVVVDEEHENSFKQNTGLKYNGRDAAIMLARLHSCPVLLGSATPSLESWHKAMQGQYKLHRLPLRAAYKKMPQTQVVNLRQTKKDPDLPFWLSLALYEEMQNTLARKEQVALFLNRRGSARMRVCKSCGASVECPNCDINLVEHAGGLGAQAASAGYMVCHYCDYSESVQDQCGQCKDTAMVSIGLGTQRVEQDIAQLFPEARVARADRDELTNREALEEMIRHMQEERTDILVGTQMIAKGLDFKKLTLVGVLLADLNLNMPDFRAGEKAFQMLMQVSGRSGRAREGKVVVQTFNPDHPSIACACANNYEGFARGELSFRKELLYPPFGALCVFLLESLHLEKAKRAAGILACRMQSLQQKEPLYSKVQILGPAPAPLGYLCNKHRYQIIVKTPKGHFAHFYSKILFDKKNWLPKGVRLVVNKDPLGFM